MTRTVLLLLAGLTTWGVSAHSHDIHARQPFQPHQHAARQNNVASSGASSSTPAPPTTQSSSSQAPSASAPPASAPAPASGTPPAASSASTPAAPPGAPPAPPSSGTPTPAASGASTSALPDATLTATDSDIPPLSDITSGMPTTTYPLTSSATLGAPGPFAGFPPIPSTTLTLSNYPTPTGTIVPILNPADVQEWLKELEGHQIPDIPPTVEGGCAANPQAAADPSRCWWTCGGCTRSTDITTCPDKNTWGLTFDDGPSPSTPRLLEYLQKENLKASFCAVGGSTYFFSDTLRAEYAAGHQVIVHTYRHPMMTTLTTPEIVAELGYTRKIIKDTIGVTPAYWRPPYGDVDDRVRAIAFAMGLTTSIWTRNPSTLDQFDTNDWQIPAGNVNGPQSLQQFEKIIANASMLNTGFIVLEHDLYQQTVDLAVGYTLPFALSHQPKFNIMPINDCIHLAPTEAYVETMQNKSRPAPETTWTGPFIQNPSQLNITAGPSSSGSDGSTGSGGSAGGQAGNGAERVAAGFGKVTMWVWVAVAVLVGAVVV